ncbi:hypothetical protein CISIN_1g0282851mg, partial [Citrus sinensis]
AAITGEADGVA